MSKNTAEEQNAIRRANKAKRRKTTKAKAQTGPSLFQAIKQEKRDRLEAIKFGQRVNKIIHETLDRIGEYGMALLDMDASHENEKAAFELIAWINKTEASPYGWNTGRGGQVIFAKAIPA